MQFLKQLLSIGEVKVSALILCLFASIGCGLYLCVERGDIPPNLASLIHTLVLTIAGVNVVHGVGGYWSKSKEDAPGEAAQGNPDSGQRKR